MRQCISASGRVRPSVSPSSLPSVRTLLLLNDGYGDFRRWKVIKWHHKKWYNDGIGCTLVVEVIWLFGSLFFSFFSLLFLNPVFFILLYWSCCCCCSRITFLFHRYFLRFFCREADMPVSRPIGWCSEERRNNIHICQGWGTDGYTSSASRGTVREVQWKEMILLQTSSFQLNVIPYAKQENSWLFYILKRKIDALVIVVLSFTALS